MEGTPCCLPLLVFSGASIGTDTARMNDDSARVDGKAFASRRICLSSLLSLIESLLGEASLEVSREPFIGERSMMRKVRGREAAEQRRRTVETDSATAVLLERGMPWQRRGGRLERM